MEANLRQWHDVCALQYNSAALSGAGSYQTAFDFIHDGHPCLEQCVITLIYGPTVFPTPFLSFQDFYKTTQDSASCFHRTFEQHDRCSLANIWFSFL